MIQRLSRRPSILVFFYIVVITGLSFASLRHYRYDDPFITYRYARNLQEGLGFVYNPGERVQSTTTPLFTLLLAVGGWLWADIPRLAVLVGAASLAAGGLCLWDMARTWKTPMAGWAALFLYPTFNLLLFTLGSETPLYLALGLGAMALYLRGRYGLAAVLAALAALARPDGLLIIVIFAADTLFFTRRPIPWRALGVYLVIVLAWFIFAWGYFGSPLPVTLAAKHNQGSLAISQPFALGLLTILRSYTGQWYHYLQFAFFLPGIIAWLRRPARWGLLVIWTVAYFAAYSLLGVSHYFWYYAPLVPAFVVITGLGLQAASDRLSFRPRLAQVVVTGVILAVSLAQTQLLWSLRSYNDPRADVYTAIGEWLRANTPIQAQVGSLEVGIIGYFSKRPMLDFAGLLQPDVAAQLKPGGSYEAAAEYAFVTYRPENVVLKEGDFSALRAILDRQSCRVIQHFAGASYQFDGNFDIYACP